MVRWGILGLGRAAHSFVNAINEVENAQLTAIASQSKNKMLTFGKKFNIDNSLRFESYEDLINCNKIDAVYIATLNNKHASLIIKCIDAKKGILCEKPMIMTTTEHNQVFERLYSSKVFFLENIAYRSHPQSIEIVNQILNDKIGDIIKIESSYGFKVNPILKFKPFHRLFSKKFGGGALNDIGCYPVSFAVCTTSVPYPKIRPKSDSVL